MNIIDLLRAKPLRLISLLLTVCLPGVSAAQPVTSPAQAGTASARPAATMAAEMLSSQDVRTVFAPATMAQRPDAPETVVASRVASDVPSASVEKEEQGGQGLANVVVPPITPEQAAIADKAGFGIAPLAVTLPEAAAGPATLLTSLSDMARALKHDPDLIYEHVLNNIDFIPIYGIKKGALGALIDGAGTAADQAELMVRLLEISAAHNPAISNPRIMQGVIDLDAGRLRRYAGIGSQTNCEMTNYALRILTAGGIPKSIAPANAACPSNVYVTHFWVRVTLSGIDHDFDPSLKSYDFKSNIDLLNASGFDFGRFLTDARSGATITPDFVQNINRAAIRQSLESYTARLTEWIRNNRPAARIEDIIGGRTIRPSFAGAPRQSALPYIKAGTVAASLGSRVPDALRPILRVRFKKSAEASFAIDRSFFSDDLAGRRLTLFFPGGIPHLALDGVTQQSGTTPYNLQTDYTEVYLDVIEPVTAAKDVFKQVVRVDGSYLIANSWGPSGRATIDQHQQALQTAKANGQPDQSEATLGASLAIIAQNWIAQSDILFARLDQLAGTTTQIHHHVGIAGQSASGPYVDLPGNKISVVSNAPSSLDAQAIASAVLYTASGHTSVFESTAVQQAAGIPAVSTVKLIDIAAASGFRLYNARAANYGAIAPLLNNCSAANKNAFLAATNAGRRLILPDRCNITEESWRGVGYFDISATGSTIGAIIGGGLFGGYSARFQPPLAVNANVLKALFQPISRVRVTGRTFGDPIDMFKGTFLYSHDDISVGEGEFPATLGFQRLYSSGARRERGSLGYGWTHNLASTVQTSADGFQSLGEDSAIDGAAAIVEMIVSLNLLVDTSKPLDQIVMAALAQRWLSDQLINNTVVVSQGQNDEIFVRLPDGSYNPPPGATARLTRNPDGSFRYETLERVVMAFNATGQLQSWTDPAGLVMTLSYSGSNLIGVVNNLGRSLSFTYSGDRLVAIGDNNGRTVRYGYDAVGNLTDYTDTLGHRTVYEYDVPGRLTRLFYPTAPASPFLINDYDNFDRVRTQTNAHGRVYNYHFAGSRSEEVAPDGTRLISYHNPQGQVIRSLDGLIRETQNEYDGMGRPVRTIFPEGNQLVTNYDDASCGGSLRRCSHNPRTISRIAKPGSALPDLVESRTYEPLFGKVVQRTDAGGGITDYSYDPVSGNLISQQLPADGAGVRPTTSFEYGQFGGVSLLVRQRELINGSGEALVTRFTYDAANNFVPAEIIVDESGLNLVTRLAYDAVGNRIRSDGPRTDVSDVTRFAYDNERRLIEQSDAAGKLTRYVYDSFGNAVRTSRQIGTVWQTTCTEYSLSFQKLRIIGPGLTANAAECPAAQSPTPVQSFAYDAQDRLNETITHLSESEGGNRTNRTVHDAAGAIIAVERGAGTAEAQRYALVAYTPNGKQAHVTDASGHVTSFQYDGHDRLSALIFPDRTNGNRPAPCGEIYQAGDDCERYSYDAKSNLVARRLRDGQLIRYEFDALDRLIVKRPPENEQHIAYSYDLRGHILTATFPNGDTLRNVSNSYDRLGRLVTTSALGGRRISYDYDQAGNRTRLTYPDGDPLHISFSYDALNRLTFVFENSAIFLAAFEYDDLGRQIVRRPVGSVSRFDFDGSDRLLRLSHDLGGSDDDLTIDYGYNQAGDITTRHLSNSRYSFGGYYEVDRAYVSNGLNQYERSGPLALSYDQRGNLTSDTLWDFGYDSENRLRSASDARTAVSLSYDAADRLHSHSLGGVKSYYLYDGDTLLAEYDDGLSLKRRFIGGDAIDEPLLWYEGPTVHDRRIFSADHLGSIIAVSNPAGTVSNRFAYGHHGETVQTDGSPFLYTGQRLIAGTGLYHYRARAYSPWLGRFMQVDPVGSADDLNLYQYVYNNPVSYTDPSGECGPPCALLLNAAGGAAVGVATELAFQTAQNIASGRSLTNIDGGKVLAAGAVGAAAGVVGRVAASYFIKTASNKTKGIVGEAATRIGIALRGERVLARDTAARSVAALGSVSGRAGNARPDFVVQTLAGAIRVIESKFGQANLSAAQRALRNTPGIDFTLSRTSYERLRLYAAGTAGTTAPGAARLGK